MEHTPSVDVRSYPPSSRIVTRPVSLPPVEEIIAKTNVLVQKLDMVIYLQKLIPVVKRVFDEKYAKTSIDNPKRIACGLCLDVGQPLGHLAKAIQFEAYRLSEAKQDRGGGLYAIQERRRASDSLYSRIMSYFENEEWEDFRPRKARPPNQKFSLQSESDFPDLSA